ncbi:hypothetical protein GE061_009867 [Apolygus lucorum]|uniref:Endonuclease/exonuclease/phosphatase domain-containing protein n=1 Tax=Apolygus lucorum TaxID=248454 RepID=A0A8S9Y3H8_APOLU|nr:hypothetical protein GE061_009867 [Apolygus lucorum]
MAFGASYTNAKGRRLMEALDMCNLVYLNDGSPTRVGSVNQRNRSVVDLSLSSPGLAGICGWTTADDSFCSDHYPIVIDISTLQVRRNEIIRHRKWNSAGADWEKFVEALANVDIPDDVSYTEFVAILEAACEEAIPVLAGAYNPKYFNVWWTRECHQAVQQRQAALHSYNANPIMQLFVIYKECVAISKKVIKMAKRTSWASYCSELNRSTPIRALWLRIRRLTNRKVSNIQPLVAGLWCEELLKSITPDSVIVNSCGITGANTHSSSILPNVDLVLGDITINELKNAIKASTNTAPGKDLVDYPIVKHLPDALLHHLLVIFNKIWQTDDFPTSWREVIAVPIPKPGDMGDSLPDGVRILQYADDICLYATGDDFNVLAVAIREALRYAGTRSEELVVVVTDCRSALLKLSNFCMQANVNHIFIEILEEVYRMKVRGQKVRFVWTRAHVGVTGNEFADSLSNSARRNGLNLDVRLPFTDLYVVAYRQLKAGWQQLYDDARVGNHYRQMNPRIAVKPWFSRFELSRPDIRVINRLRSNHGLCGAYLHRIGLRSSSGCEDCGEEEETLKHIFMDCPIHWQARHQMLNSVGLHLENPLHFDQIINCNLLSVYKEVCNFIKTTTKKI